MFFRCAYHSPQAVVDCGVPMFCRCELPSTGWHEHCSAAVLSWSGSHAGYIKVWYLCSWCLPSAVLPDIELLAMHVCFQASPAISGCQECTDERGIIEIFMVHDVKLIANVDRIEVDVNGRLPRVLQSCKPFSIGCVYMKLHARCNIGVHHRNG